MGLKSLLMWHGFCSDFVPSHFPPILQPLEKGISALLEGGLWSVKTFGFSQKMSMLFKAQAQWWFCCRQARTLDFSVDAEKGLDSW